MKDSRRSILQKLSLAAFGLVGTGSAAAHHRDDHRRGRRNADDSDDSEEQSPHPDEPHAVPGRIQAQHFDDGGQDVAYHDTTDENQGGAYRTDESVDIEETTDSTGGEYNVGWVEAGEWLEYTVDVAEASVYDVRFRVASAEDGGALSLALDGENVTGTVSFDGTGGWQEWTTVTARDVELPAGEHVLRLRMEDDAFNLNWFEFVDNESDDSDESDESDDSDDSEDSDDPEEQSPYLDEPHAVPGRIQSQHFDDGGQDVAYHDTTDENQGGAYRTDESVDIEETTDATGGGYNVGWVEAGEWLEYTVDVAEASVYDVQFRVASAMGGGALSLALDSENVTGTVSFDGTGGWQEWTTVTARDVELPAGEHVLRLRMEDDAFNLNWMNFGSFDEPDEVDEIEGDTPVGRHGQLQVDGTDIVGEHGNPVQLTGMSSHGLQWFGWGDCITPESLDTHAAWGADILRIAMYTESDGYLSDPDGFTEQVHTIVEEVTQRGQYALIDWHNLSDNDPMEHVDEAKEFFDEMASTYADHDSVIYEICNEPNGEDVDWDRIVEYADQVVPVIRNHDSDALIVIGTPSWSGLGFADFGTDQRDYIVENQYDDPNVAYTYHFYAATHGDWERREVEQTAQELPLFVTEWGSMNASGDGDSDWQSAEAWLELMNEHNISWCNWNYSDDFRTSGIWEEGTGGDGPWTEDNLTEVGRWIRDQIEQH